MTNNTPTPNREAVTAETRCACCDLLLRRGNAICYECHRAVLSDMPGDVKRLREELDNARNVTLITSNAYEAELSRLRGELAEKEADARRWQWGVKHARWIRHEHEAYIAIPVALDANLSSVALRVNAIDAAIKDQQP